LLTVLVSHHRKGDWEGGAFNNRTWVQIVKEFEKKAKLGYDKSQLQNRWKHLKETFRDYHSLLARSGWGLDPTTSCPVAPDESTWFEVCYQ